MDFSSQEEGRGPWGIWKTVHIPPGQSFHLSGRREGRERGPQRREAPGTHEEASLDGPASGVSPALEGGQGKDEPRARLQAHQGGSQLGRQGALGS